MTPTPARRVPLWVALLFVLAVLITLAVLRWQAPMIGAAAVGVPLVLASDLRGSGRSARTVAVVAVIGALLGLVWALITGDIVALSPPLIVEKPHVDRMMGTLADALSRDDADPAGPTVGDRGVDG